ncbi:unnamed protein product [Moneuplotes crassus]|nr:unnamed protein product [Moneuplotes crassus]
MLWAFMGTTSASWFPIDSSTWIDITLDQPNNRLVYNASVSHGHFFGTGVQNSFTDADIYGIQCATDNEDLVRFSNFDVFLSQNGEAQNYTQPGYEGVKHIISEKTCSSSFTRPLSLVRDGRNQTLEYNRYYNMTYVYDEQYYEEKGFENRGFFYMIIDKRTGGVMIYEQLPHEELIEIEEISA